MKNKKKKLKAVSKADILDIFLSCFVRAIEKSNKRRRS